MRSERIGLVSVLAARAPRVKIMFLDEGRRSVNARSVKLTRSSQGDGEIGEWCLLDVRRGTNLGAVFGEREFKKGRGADEIGTRTRGSSTVCPGPSA